MGKTFRRTMRVFSTLAILSAFGIVVSIGMEGSNWTAEKTTANINSELPEIKIKNVDEPYKY